MSDTNATPVTAEQVAAVLVAADAIDAVREAWDTAELAYQRQFQAAFDALSRLVHNLGLTTEQQAAIYATRKLASR